MRVAEGGKERNEEERERKRKIRAVEGEGRVLGNKEQRGKGVLLVFRALSRVPGPRSA